MAAARTPFLPRLLFGLRLASSVCLALFTTYYLELPNPFWAATTAAIVCQPNLGASLQKGRFRALGTIIGALVLVALLSLFPQQRVAMILSLSLWCGLCGWAVVLLRNSGAYAAGLAGITAAILFADSVADPTAAFFLALTRVSEICIGIAAAAVVMRLTEPGAARLALAGLMERTALQLRDGFLETLAGDSETPSMQAARRNVVKALTPLNAAIDAAIGETAFLYSRRAYFRIACARLVDALVAWRTVSRHPFGMAGDARPIQRELARRLARIDPVGPERDPPGVRAEVERTLADIEALRAATADDAVSGRIAADAARDVATCLAALIDAVILLRRREGPRLRAGRQPFVMADARPAWIAGVRAVLSVLAVTLFWIVTAWPSGAYAIAFTAISTLVFASFADEARQRAADYTTGIAVMAALGGGLYFWVLPALSSFPALMGVLFLLYVPLGAMQVGSWHSAAFLAMSIAALPLLGIGNPIAYDPVGYVNVALAVTAGSAAGALFFVILPGPGPEQRARRLIRLSVRDLGRLLRKRAGWDRSRWTALLTRRLESIPPQATPEQHGALLALLAVGLAVTRLRPAVEGGPGAKPLADALAALAAGDLPVALGHLATLGRLAAGGAIVEPSGSAHVEVQVAVLADAVAAHAALFGPEPIQPAES
ncbi:FUSC family protein [Ancylobacter lacus]|uniref:FUSC family protein n=1 Tax=Ancylobacter lacus TaxID=2579970 RepID=UPI001FE517B7|nr:FUSC family protein [Ancylobacter lacus]